MYGCYLLDENGDRWDHQGNDSAGMVNANVQLIPGTRVRSKFDFVAKDANTGTRFTLICIDNQFFGGRKVIIEGIGAQ
jgi:hypothetical protein